MKPSAQHRQAAQAFDLVAGDYDSVYGEGGNPAMVWMRRENVTHLRSLFSPGSRLLEVGCGTGDEAVALARSGCSVVATDISPAMARLTAAKAVRAGVAERVQVLALPAGSLAALLVDRPFDGVYTSFGGLNCEPDLAGFGEALSRLVRPGGAVVCGVMGRFYLFEMLWYLARGRPRQSLRRLRGGWQEAPVAGRNGRQMHVATRYLGVREIHRAVGEQFVVEEIRALPLVMPPPYAAELYARYPGLIARLEGLDRALRRRWPFRLLGDHLVVVFRRLRNG
ncbi:MAG: methyltransferase domain-containing protein [Anaerolineae bacterium]|nr:methyltransferase domain-containing protein [Anaerolineae bacterium]